MVWAWRVAIVLLLLSGVSVWRVTVAFQEFTRRIQEAQEMTATTPWTSGGTDIRVSTTRGVDSPGWPATNGENETVSEWKARHQARVAEAETEFPRD